MTNKTHTILKALRKLREENHEGAVSPEVIKQMTGIDNAVKMMNHLKRSGYLIYQKNPVAVKSRSNCKPNAYFINPESDLMPVSGNGRKPAKPKVSNLFAEQQAEQERIYKIGAKLFAITCQQWPFTVSRRITQ